MKRKSFVNNAINNSINGTDQSDLEILLGLMDELLVHENNRFHNETFTDAVHDLLGQTAYVDNIFGYKYDAINLLGVLANSEVRKAIDENCKLSKSGMDSIIELIQNFWYFMQRIDTEIYKIQLLKRDIESFPSNYTDRLPDLIEEFAERLRIKKTGKLKSYEID